MNVYFLECARPFAGVRQELQPVLIRKVVPYVSQKWRQRIQRPKAQEIGFAAGFNPDVGQLKLS